MQGFIASAPNPHTSASPQRKYLPPRSSAAEHFSKHLSVFKKHHGLGSQPGKASCGNTQRWGNQHRVGRQKGHESDAESVWKVASEGSLYDSPPSAGSVQVAGAVLTAAGEAGGHESSWGWRGPGVGIPQLPLPVAHRRARAAAPSWRWFQIDKIK